MKKHESIFDCSRTMLPEHKLRIINDERAQGLRSKPVLNAQEWELIDPFRKVSVWYREDPDPIGHLMDYGGTVEGYT